MTISKSKEVRWFFDVDDDKVPSIVEWFKHFETSWQSGAGDIYWRKDYYLQMPGIDDLGVKLREPKKIL